MEMTVMNSGRIKNGGFMPFVINDTKGKRIFGTRLFGQPSGRELVFIIPPRQKGAMPRVKFVSQLLAPLQVDADKKSNGG